MAVWKRQIDGHSVKVHNVDHPPPHCHVEVGGKDLKIDMAFLSVMNPPPHELPGRLRRKLAQVQESLLEAWERVQVNPPGSDRGW